MSDLNDKPIVVNLNMDKETTDYIAKHDYIKVGNKVFISRDRAKMLVGKLANGADKSTEPALHKHIVSVSVCPKCGCNKMTGDGSKSWCLNEKCDFVEAD